MLAAGTDSGQRQPDRRPAEILAAGGPSALGTLARWGERGAMSSSAPVPHPVLESVATPVAVIWLAAAAISVAAPDMVSGSEHEHLPLALMTVGCGRRSGRRTP